MKIWNALKTFYLNHGQTSMALLGVTLSSLSLADPTLITGAFGPKGPAYLTLAASLVVGWRGILASKSK